MPAAKLDITIEQGATYKQSLVVKSGTPLAPMDLSGYSARMQIRPDVKSQDLIADLSTANSKITISGPDGLIEVAIPASETSLISATSGVYDLELESPTGVVTRLIQGKVKISPEVTR